MWEVKLIKSKYLDAEIGMGYEICTSLCHWSWFVPALTENYLDPQRLWDLLWKGNIPQISFFHSVLSATLVEVSTISTIMLKRLKGKSIAKGIV